jgi:hypothetical protein
MEKAPGKTKFLRGCSTDHLIAPYYNTRNMQMSEVPENHNVEGNNVERSALPKRKFF